MRELKYQDKNGNPIVMTKSPKVCDCNKQAEKTEAKSTTSKTKTKK